LNNLIGVPKTLAQVEPDDRYVVLEIGIDRPGEMDRLADMTTPDVGVITSVSEAHLERMGDIETVVKEKSRLFKSLKPGGLAVVPHDSPYREDLVAASKAPAVTFGTTLGSDYFAADPKMKTRGCYRFLLETPHGKGEVELQVPGEHMVQAATAAAAVAVSSGLPLAGVIEGLQTFTGLPGRCEVIEMTDGITVIADHYNANPVSMKSAQHLLESFVERRKVFIAGEMWDLGTQSVSLHRMVGKRLGSGSIDLLVAVGPKTRELTRAAQEAGLPRRSIRWFDTTETAALEVPRLLMPSDVVLVKGSRGMKLEKVVDSLTRHFGSQAGSRGNSC
jgi:UDP-N-acetylmuramoyl-tripeptide--D-alanyl-D-alanine ligase